MNKRTIVYDIQIVKKVNNCEVIITVWTIFVHNILLKDSLDSHIISVLSAKGKLTKKFGGYGQMINSEQFTSIAESSFQFQALTSELYLNDLEDISNGDSERLESCADHLLHVIKELQC